MENLSFTEAKDLIIEIKSPLRNPKIEKIPAPPMKKKIKRFFRLDAVKRKLF